MSAWIQDRMVDLGEAVLDVWVELKEIFGIDEDTE